MPHLYKNVMAEFTAFNTRLFVCSEIVLAKCCVSASDWQQSWAGTGSEAQRVPTRLPGINGFWAVWKQAGCGSAACWGEQASDLCGRPVSPNTIATFMADRSRAGWIRRRLVWNPAPRSRRLPARIPAYQFISKSIDLPFCPGVGLSGHPARPYWICCVNNWWSRYFVMLKASNPWCQIQN